jgi:hypothetical protein
MLGSERATEDIDVLVESNGLDIRTLRRQIAEADPRFAANDIKFYYIGVSALALLAVALC